jgi:hypothetical protein
MEVSANNSQALLNNQQNTERNRGQEKQVAEIIEQQSVSRQDQATSAQPLTESSETAQTENRNNQQIERSQPSSLDGASQQSQQITAEESLGSQLDITV